MAIGKPKCQRRLVNMKGYRAYVIHGSNPCRTANKHYPMKTRVLRMFAQNLHNNRPELLTVA
jgi:hypothetical protein